MADEKHKLQTEPPEGSREVIDHELERQADDHTADEPGSLAKMTQDPSSNRVRSPKAPKGS